MGIRQLLYRQTALGTDLRSKYQAPLSLSPPLAVSGRGINQGSHRMLAPIQGSPGEPLWTPLDAEDVRVAGNKTQRLSVNSLGHRLKA